MRVPALWPHSPGPAAGRRAGRLAVFQHSPPISLVFPMLPPSPAQCYLGSVCHKVEVLFWALPLRVGHINVLSSVINALVIPAREVSVSPGCGAGLLPFLAKHPSRGDYLTLHRPVGKEKGNQSPLLRRCGNGGAGMWAGYGL